MSSIYRDKVVNKLVEILKINDVNNEENEKKMRNLEIAVFNYTVNKVRTNWGDSRFCECYKNKARSLICNLNPKGYVGNKTLLYRFLEEEFDFKTLCFNMNHQDMCPERWEEAVEENHKADMKRWGVIDPESMPDGAVQCRKCKSWKTTYYALMTRSADEPMTNFATCLKCKFNWRFE